MKKSARSGRVNYKPCAKCHSLPVPLPFQSHFASAICEPAQRNLIHVFDAQLLSFLDQKAVEVSPVPMRVSNLIARAGRNQQLILRVLIRRLR